MSAGDPACQYALAPFQVCVTFADNRRPAGAEKYPMHAYISTILREMRAYFTLHFDFKAQLDITTRLTTSNTPILFRNFTQQDFYMILGNSERFQVVDDGLI